jgi:hypothetical protein
MALMETKVSSFSLPQTFQKYLTRLFLDQVDLIDKSKYLSQITREELKFSESMPRIRNLEQMSI